MMADYYLLRKQKLERDDLYNLEGGRYHYRKGWNDAAMIAFGVGAVFAIATVWVPFLAVLSGYAWLLGAGLGGLVYYNLAKKGFEV